MESLVEVRVLGTVGLADGSGQIPLTAPKVRRLLAALTITSGETCSADALIDAIWDVPPPSARKLLQLYVSQLRKVIDLPISLQTDADGYRLVLPRDALDSARFEALVADGRAAMADDNPVLARSVFKRALRLWHGAAYGDLSYEAFARAEADRLEELRLVADEDRIDAELALGHHAQVLPEVCSRAAASPLRERTQAQAMLALYRCGRQSDALELYASARRALHDELGLEPGPELRELQMRILRHDPRLTAEVQPQRFANLPTPPTTLVGRDRELGELEELLAGAGLRLLVLTGAGGSGKTRLAIEVAHRVRGAFANGLRFVELAPLNDPAQVIPSIARAVGLARIGADPIAELVQAIRSHELLLVLDNAEHVRDAAPQLVRLLAEAPRVSLLVTSRAVLHVSGEHVYPVEPLSSAAAVELYVQRAGALDLHADADEESRRNIDAICARLDRLPLAIELAAAHARALTPVELLARLDRRLPLLAGAPRDLPARQLTLETTIDWSMSLLGDAGQRDLACLAVFAGGWPLDAAETVCGVDLDGVMRLLDHSLLVRTTNADGSRYEMLETVHAYALARFEGLPEAPDIRARHARYFGSIADSAALYIEAQGRMQHRLVRRERENLLNALAWTLESGEIELGLRIAAALENYWVTSAPLEGVDWLRRFLARADRVDRLLHARAVRVLGAAVAMSGDMGEGRRLYEASLGEYRSLGDEVGVGILEHRLALFVADDGRHADAARMASESIRRHQDAGFFKGAALGMGVLGTLERSQGNSERALELLEESLRFAREGGYTWWTGQMLFAMAELLLDQGEPDRARARLVESIPILREIDDRNNTIEALALLAKIEAIAGRPGSAGRFWGAVQAEEARAPTGLWQATRATYEAALEPEADEMFRQAETAGRELSLAAALREAGAGLPQSGP